MMSSLDLYVSPGIMCAFDEEIRLIAQGYNGLVETVSNPIVIEVAQDLGSHIVNLLASNRDSDEGGMKLMLFGYEVDIAFRALSNVMAGITDQVDPETKALLEDMMSKMSAERLRMYGPRLERARIPIFLDELP
jgi:hypothetical protein